jgi:hypothetical protein
VKTIPAAVFTFAWAARILCGGLYQAAVEVLTIYTPVVRPRDLLSDARCVARPRSLDASSARTAWSDPIFTAERSRVCELWRSDARSHATHIVGAVLPM